MGLEIAEPLHGEGAKNPEMALAALVNGRLGTEISDGDIRRLFESDWMKLSLLGHAIHDNLKKERAHGR